MKTTLLPPEMQEKIGAESGRIARECWRKNMTGRKATRYFDKQMAKFIKKTYPNLSGGSNAIQKDSNGEKPGEVQIPFGPAVHPEAS